VGAFEAIAVGAAAGWPAGRASAWEVRRCAQVTAQSEVLLIGGRSGVGKSIVGNELHAQPSTACIRHCLIEGDNLDMAYPAP
jgi:2-phosphoglycerate kinase